MTVWATRGSDAADSSAALADSLGARLGPAATFATTEHFNLQTARSLTVSEANGRASIYLAALSSNLIALAFIAQVSGLGGAFHAFAGRSSSHTSSLSEEHARRRRSLARRSHPARGN